MYCSNCGIKANGNFCAACGARLQAPENVQPPAPVVPLGDWKQETVYETLLQHPQVRDRLALAAKRSPKRVTGEDLLAIYDTLVPSVIPLGKLTTALLPVFDRMGIKTGKQSQLAVQAPIGHTLVTILCAMAARGYELQQVDQLPDGCVFTARVPSTITTNRGELLVSVNQGPQAIQVQAAVKISGQLLDWGKSNQILRELFDDVRRELAPKGPPALPRRNVA